MLIHIYVSLYDKLIKNIKVIEINKIILYILNKILTHN